MVGNRCNRPLTSSQANRFTSALGLLQAGRVREAMAVARLLAWEAPLAADAHQLYAMCSAGSGDMPAAEEAFRRALELAPDAPVIALNFSAWLGQQGRPREGMRVLAGLAATVPVALTMGVLARQAGELAQARSSYERVVWEDPTNVRGWRGLGGTLLALRAYGLAVTAFRKVVDLSKEDRLAWFDLGVALRLQGKAEEALECLLRAASCGESGPELPDTINGVLQDLGRTLDAIEGARNLLAAHPGFAQGHETYAQLVWENGARFAVGVDPFSAFRAAAQAQPSNLDLQRRLVRTLLGAHQAAQAWEWLEHLDWASTGDPVLGWLAAEALDAIGRLEEATAVYERLHGSLARISPQFLNARARHAFRRRQFDLAGQCATWALELDPRNQEAWAHLGTAWRLAGDPREDWLFDYEQLVGYVEVEPPAEYPDVAAYLDSLSTSLQRMHRADREPIHQSVRNGSQTSGRLFGQEDPVIVATATVLNRAAARWLRTLPTPVSARSHPFLSRANHELHFVGSWSVKLRSSGRHANHIHNEGWMSSAFHVALPACIRDGGPESREGWIQFGQPMEELGLALPPRRLVRPRAGYLALFPSYMWHGTIPFEDETPRMTIAFDMQPA